MKNRLLSVLKFRPRHIFAVMVATGLLVVPAVTALAYYGATGTGNITGISASSTSPSTVSLDAAVAPTSLALGGSTTFPVNATCTAGCPGYVSTVNLASWSSDKAGCTAAAFPGSFTMPAVNSGQSAVLVGASPTLIGNATITWNNLGTDQGVCKGAAFTFVLTTP